jgi:glycosyltransferase involved in cell wall biosynthesis
MSSGWHREKTLAEDKPLTLLHVSDRRYFVDREGRWFTGKPLALTDLAGAFSTNLKRWIFFGRLLPLQGEPKELSLIRPPPGISVEFQGARQRIAGLPGFLVHLGAYNAALGKSLAEAHLVWAELSHVASVLALLRRPRHAFMMAQLTVEPGDALALRGGPFWYAVGWLSRWLNRWALARADVCIFVSEYLRDRFVVPGRPEYVVHEECVRKSDLVRVPRPRPARAPKILYVGRLAPEKGVDVLVRATQIVARRTNVRLRIVGAGRERGRLLGLVHRLGLDDLVEFAGLVPWGEHLFGEMRMATCLVLPSLSEGYPRVILEALSQGTPVVASATGGIPEAVDYGRAGLLVPPGDVEKLGEAILRLVEDDTLWARLAEEGLRFAWMNTVDVQVERLKVALSGASGGPFPQG